MNSGLLATIKLWMYLLFGVFLAFFMESWQKSKE